MSWGTLYSGSNNIHHNEMAIMSDGKQFTLYNPACDLNKKLQAQNGMKNNYEYRQFLINNGISLMGKNNMSICNAGSECVMNGVSKNKSFGKYLYKSAQDMAKPYGHQTSDLKNMYLDKQELNSTYVTPIVTQDELLKYAARRM
jgi:hypothetical protein